MRTPIGAFQGVLAPLTAPQLGAAAIKGALGRGAASPAPTCRKSSWAACCPRAWARRRRARPRSAPAIPSGVPTTTINKMCGSGMKAIMMAADQIRTGDIAIAVAGGLESMSNAPYLLPKARAGMRMGHGEVLDHMFYDGLQSPFDGQLMGCFAENTAQKYGFTRADQDAFATESDAARGEGGDAGRVRRRNHARHGQGPQGRNRASTGTRTPFTVDLAKIPTLKPAFRKDGTVTAASSSSISDGAAATVLMSAAEAHAPRHRAAGAHRRATPASRSEPEWFTTAPAGAIAEAARAGSAGSAADVHLYEVNEAFAVVTMAAMRDVGFDHARTNVHGGACALGHPIGATGARIVATLVHALRARGGGRGIASLCIGGGEATAIAVEVPS